MAKIWFLEASVPLAKVYFKGENNEITAEPYPIVSRFKSHETEIDSLKTMYTEIVAHAKQGHSLIKGILHRDLEWANRRKSTQTADKTEWVCLDLDGAPFNSHEEFMNGHPHLKDVSYIVQYSASQGFNKKGLRCHIFFLLDKEYPAPFLKSWLMGLNLDGTYYKGAVRQALTMNDAGTCLKWPIDITCCQNDKIIYIAPPIIKDGVPYNPPKPAIQYVAKKLQYMPTSRIVVQKLETWKVERNTILNNMRKEAGLQPLRATRSVKGRECHGKTGEIQVTEIIDCGDYVRLNLNGGDSSAYWHPKNNFEFIENFKGEPALVTKDSCPAYYQECLAVAQHEAMQPTEEGEIILGICDTKSSNLWKVSWNENTHNLQLYPARSDKQLADWLMQHGRAPGDFTPQWTMEFNPANKTIVDVEKQYINTYVPSVHYRNKLHKGEFPTIKKILMSVVSNNEWNEITEHFVNWLAVLVQHRIKIGTTWLLSGTEGTGKNLMQKIMREMIGTRYVKEVLITGLEDQFNGWLEHSMLCFVNEIQVSSSAHRNIIAGKLRNWITDSPLDIRPMGQTRYDAENYCNFIMGSNKRDAVDIDNGDRRYNIGIYQEKRLAMTQREVEQLIPQEIPAFFAYLMTYKASIEKARTIIETESRRDVILANRNSVDMLADALLEGDMSPFVEALPDMHHIASVSGNDSAKAVAYHTIVTRELQLLVASKPKEDGMCRVESRLSRDELFILFDYCIGGMPNSPAKFTRLLKHKSIETKRLRAPNGENVYGLRVEWSASNAWCEEYRPEKQKLKRVK